MITIRWKSIQKKIVPVVLGMIFILSMSIQIYKPFNSVTSTQTNPNTIQTPLVSQLDYEIPISGQGNLQDVYVYMQNHSIANGVNEFNISSENGAYYLNDGTFNFTMNKNHLANYTLENDDSLHYEREKVSISTTSDMFTIVTGSENAGADFISVDSALSGDQVVETNISIDASAYPKEISTILGFKIQLEIQSGSDLLLNSSLYNYYSTNFDVLDSDRYIQEISSNYRTITYYIRNENNNYINISKNLVLNLHFRNATEAFTLLINSLKVDVIRGHEVSFSLNNPIALEFDIRGDSTVFGFQAWIRALDIEDSVTSNLTIQLCQANISEPVARSQLLNPSNSQLLATPDETAILSEISILNYSNDEPMWFNFTSNHLGVDLSVGNYFIVISTNTSSVVGEKRFTLVSIPFDAPFDPKDPDNKIDHLLLTKSTTWEQAKATLKSTSDHPQLDASNFIINLSRPYLPSEIGLTIDDIPVEDTYIWDYPHDTLDDPIDQAYYASYWWGYGTIKLDFSTPIGLSNQNFTITLDWDQEIYSGNISFTVEYLVQKYLIKTAVSTYQLEIDSDPFWNITFSFNPNESIFSDWNFTKFAYVIPDNWEISDLFENNTQILSLAEDPFIEDEKTFIEINSSVADSQAVYTLSANSPNYIKDSNLFLKYNDNLWETKGFMQNDVIALSVGLLTDDNSYLSTTGKVTARLYNTTGNLMQSNILTDDSIDENSSYSWFNFENMALFNTNQTTPLGEYTILLNWTDGNQLGFLKISFYLNEYKAAIHEFNHLEEEQVNQLIGTITPFKTDINTYDYTIYAVEPIVSSESSFILNESREISLGDDLYITNYAINETVLNPNENISIEVIIENRHHSLDYNVSVMATLVYANNHEWILSNVSSTYLLNMYGAANDSDEHSFYLNLTVPDMNTGGLNCPIRNMPMQIQISVNIDDSEIYNSVESQYLYYSHLNDKDFEGKVLTVRSYNDLTGPSFTSNIQRDMLELPGDVTYFIQVFNDYYMSMTMESNLSTTGNKIFGIFSDLQAETDPIDHYATQTITGKFIDENSEIMRNSEIKFFYDSRENSSDNSEPVWTPLTSKNNDTSTFTDDEGLFEFEFDMSQTPLNSEVQIMVKYIGNSTHATVNSSLTIELNTYEQNLLVYVDTSKTLIKGAHNLVNVRIENTGNSSFSNVSITINSDFDAEINIKDALALLVISSGETYEFVIDFYDNDYQLDSVIVNITIVATVKETGEIFKIGSVHEFTTYEVNTNTLLTSALVGGFIVFTIGLWLFSAKYIKTKVDEINAPITPETSVKSKKSRRRGGKYVNLADLSAKKADETETPSTEEGTSLDELLDDEKTN
ncbi:hypothetical protein [Candidatus Harpocratesius sp.]